MPDLDEVHSCRWCEPAGTQSEHRRVIAQLEDNLNAVKAEVHTLRVKNERLRYELEQARGRSV